MLPIYLVLYRATVQEIKELAVLQDQITLQHSSFGPRGFLTVYSSQVVNRRSPAADAPI